MEISDLVLWGLGIAVTVMVPVWARTAAAISRNGREVAELRGRLTAMETMHGSLSADITNVHQRIGGVARTTDRICGQNTQISSTLAVIQEHLLGREKK